MPKNFLESAEGVDKESSVIQKSGEILAKVISGRKKYSNAGIGLKVLSFLLLENSKLIQRRFPSAGLQKALC